MLWLAALLACRGNKDDTAGDTAAATDFVPEIPGFDCGGEPPPWVGTEQMGELVAVEKVDEASLSAAQIDVLLAAAGYEGVVTPLYDVETWRVRYLTQAKGEVIEATALLSLPVREDEAPVVMWGHGTTGFTDDCAPTAMGFEGAVASVLLSSIGYAIAAPDYLGLAGFGEPAGYLHPYVAPEPTAVASLDAVRALYRHAADLSWPQVPLSQGVVMWGGSEGGFAAFWADRYSTHYLPDHPVLATVAMVPPTDTVGLASAGVAHMGPTSVGMAGLLATQNEWYGRPAELTEVLTDDEDTHLATRLLEMLWAGCNSDVDYSDLEDALQTVEDVYTQQFIASASGGDRMDPWTCILDSGVLAQAPMSRGHDAPVLFQLSEEDDLVTPEVERADFDRLCDEGYDMEYLECAGASHSGGAGASLPYQIGWLADRLAGEALNETCVRTEPVDCDSLVR